MKDARQQAFYILDAMNAVRDYVASVQRPLLEELKDKDILADDFFDSRLMSSSYITREVYKIQHAKQNIDYDYKLVALNPLNPSHIGTEFENKILNDFKENKYNSYSSIILDENHTPYYYVGLPIKHSQASCADCHTPDSAPKKLVEQYGNSLNFQSQIGDTIAMISFKIPIENILSYHLKEFIVSGATIFGVFVLFIFFIYKIQKKEKEQNELLMIHQSRLALMGEMIRNISHQWKQPLAQISSTLINLELYAQRDKLTKEKLYEKIKDTDEQVKFMSNTVEYFKNFFNPNMQKKEFTSKEAIDQSLKLLNEALKTNSIKVNIDIKDNFTHFGNINDIMQVIINIINNAKEAFVSTNITDRQIHITSVAQDNMRIINIKNNAGSIDPELINKIFEPYFTTKNTGNGLGLYMCKMIMQKNKGKIFVQNINNCVIFTIVFLNS